MKKQKNIEQERIELINKMKNNIDNEIFESIEYAMKIETPTIKRTPVEISYKGACLAY